MRSCRAIFLLACVAILSSCGTENQRPLLTTKEIDAATSQASHVADALAPLTRSAVYFQRRLIADGDDPFSTFGGHISALGLDGRELQAMPIRAAFDLAHSTAMRVEDVRMRRKILLDLFDEVEP